MPGQRAVTATLETIAQTVAEQGIKAPAITLVGDVASLRDQLEWRERMPLHGRRIAVTRARAQAGTMSARLESHGAEVIEVPAIRTEAINPDSPLDPSSYSLLCVTSTNSVPLLFKRMDAAGLDARALAGVTVAAIGPGTARALAEFAIKADVVPERSVAEALVEALSERQFESALIVRAEQARDVLPQALEDKGCKVTVESLYKTVTEELTEAELAAVSEADIVTFTSASTVRNLVSALGGIEVLADPNRRLASIGPITSAELRAHGLEPTFEATQHDVDGLIDAILKDQSQPS